MSIAHTWFDRVISIPRSNRVNLVAGLRLRGARAQSVFTSDTFSEDGPG